MIELGANNVSLAIRYSDTYEDKLARKSRLVYKAAFGHSVSDWATRKSYGFLTQEEDAMAMIESLSKSLTEALIRKLVMQGKMSMNDNPVCLTGNTGRCWLKGLTAADPRAAKITIQNIFDFTVGYRDFNNVFPPARFQDALNATMAWDPGTTYYYNQFGHQLLGAVAEQVELAAGGTGDYEELARKYVLRALVIKDADMYLLKDSRPQFRDPRNVWYTSEFTGPSGYGDGKVGGWSDYQKSENGTSASGWVSTAAAYALFAHSYSSFSNGIGVGASSYQSGNANSTLVLLAKETLNKSRLSLSNQLMKRTH